MTMASSPRRTWVVLLTVVALGLLLRLGLIFMPGSAGSPEVFEYDQLARNLLSGEGYVYTHFGTPYRSYYGGVFYIWLTAGLYAAREGIDTLLIERAAPGARCSSARRHTARRIWPVNTLS